MIDSKSLSQAVTEELSLEKPHWGCIPWYGCQYNALPLLYFQSSSRFMFLLDMQNLAMVAKSNIRKYKA